MKLIWILLAMSVAVTAFQNEKILDTHRLLSRRKRWLVWKDGLNWVSVIFGVGIPVDLKANSLTLGMVMKAFYQLPNNSSYYTRPSITIERKARSPSRWKVYEMIEDYLEKNHYPDGKACLLKSICEISAVPLETKSGLLAEIVHSILTPSSTDDEILDHEHNSYHAAEQIGKHMKSCKEIYPECPTAPLEEYTKFMTVNKFVY